VSAGAHLALSSRGGMSVRVRRCGRGTRQSHYIASDIPPHTHPQPAPTGQDLRSPIPPLSIPTPKHRLLCHLGLYSFEFEFGQAPVVYAARCLHAPPGE
jgi:hypothetical protein